MCYSLGAFRKTAMLHGDRRWGIIRNPCIADRKKFLVISDSVKSGFRLNSKLKDKKVDTELQVLIVYGDTSVLSNADPGEAASEFCLLIEGE